MVVTRLARHSWLRPCSDAFALVELDPCRGAVDAVDGFRDLGLVDDQRWQHAHHIVSGRGGERVRVFSRTGHEWGAQLPAIAAALRALPVRSVILDGEGVICGPDGVSDFDRMRAVFGRKGSPDVFLYAFNVLELDGRDLCALRWDERRALLTQLLDRCQDGIRLSEHVADTDGAVVFLAKRRRTLAAT